MQVEEVDGDNKEVDDPLEAETENNMIRSDKASVITIETGDIEVKNAVYCCGVDIGVFSKSTQLFLLSSGVMVFYLVYGYVQEWIFRLPGMKSHGYTHTSSIALPAAPSDKSCFLFLWAKYSKNYHLTNISRVVTDL